jgi:hypothetical protein
VRALRGTTLTVALCVVLVVVVAGGLGTAAAIGASRASTGGGPETTTGGPTAPTGPSSDTEVQMTPAAQQHPYADQVKSLLQRYFDAINERDYSAWAGTVSAEQSAAWSEQDWLRAYDSTKDSSIKVIDIDDDPLRVRLWFTSEQDPSLAPQDLPVDCINWDVTYLLTEEQGQLVLGGLDPDATSKAPCG